MAHLLPDLLPYTSLYFVEYRLITNCMTEDPGTIMKALDNVRNWRIRVEEVVQTMEDMTAHKSRTTFLAIRLYHVIYTVLHTGSG